MQDNFCRELDQILLTSEELFFGITHVRKKYHHYMYLKIKDVTKNQPFLQK